MTDIYVIHDLGKHPISAAHPLTTGGQLITTHGFVSRKRVVIIMCLGGEIETVLTAMDSALIGYVRDGEPKISFTVDKSLQFYDVEQDYIKYSAS